MINNTAYLKRVPWVLLFGLIYGIASTFITPWIFQEYNSDKPLTFIVTNLLYNLSAYGAFSILMPRWKALFVAFFIDFAIIVLYAYLGTEGSGIKWIFYFLAVPLPLTIFISLQTGWQRKSLLVYFAILLAKVIFLQSLAGSEIVYPLIATLHLSLGTATNVLQFLSNSLAMVFYVIMIYELLNFMRSDSKKPETLVLRLGNEYNKAGAFIVFWIYKTGLFMIAISAATYLKFYALSYDFESTQNTDYNLYLRITGALSIVGSIGLTLFGAWYLRKLLLEYFITYNVQSKFLYWLAIIPLFGFLSFLFMETNQVKQQNYKGKVTTIGNFAESSTTAITIIALAPLILCLVLGISGAPPFIYISLAIICLMFTLMIFSRTGYYVNAIIIFLALAAVLAAAYLTEINVSDLSLYYFLLLIGLGQLIMLLPVYHFNKFFYTPAENPEPETDQPRDLFV